MLLHALGISRAALHADPARALTAEEQPAYDRLILRRLANEPIQYIVGEQEFYGLAFHVTPAVLIPRPETEHLVEAVLVEFGCHPAAQSGSPANSLAGVKQRRDLLLGAQPQSLQILDIGTGSGAIAIALAHHLPGAHVTATDISPAALAVAASNAARHHLAARIRFVESDLLAALAPCNSAFDAIVSNPPYVATTDRQTLHAQVRDFEPAAALFAGPNGLEIYRRLIPQALAALKPNGLLALEIGQGQRDGIASLLSGWRALRFLDDLQRIPRVALARKP